MPERPLRARLPDFAGRMISLSAEPDNWQKLKDGRGLLLMGLGPGDAAGLPFVREALAGKQEIFWLDCPEMKGLISPGPGWREIRAGELGRTMADCAVYFYRPGLRLAPGFWSPLLAKASLHGTEIRHGQKASVWLPGNKSQLLHTELAATLRKLGYQCREDVCSPQQWLEFCRSCKPDFAISINFRGLDPEGRIFHLCRELAIPLAIWLVDNPWNLLSGIALPWWQEADLFVTDPTFIAGMKEYGARNVSYLPLAASPHMFRKAGARQGAPVFVGRTAFPDQAGFFAGAKIDEALLGEAMALVEAGARPDFHWWQARLPYSLWPGKQGRAISLGADLCSARRRSEWVAAGAGSGLQVIGDSGWERLLPGSRILPPVDYYGALPDIYAHAGCALNVTSLLLPGSLNQRHFDVWAAGGFLLTDYTVGLELFPAELTGPVTVGTPAELADKIAFAQSHRQAELAAAWTECIRSGHAYRHRLALIARHLGISLAGMA